MPDNPITLEDLEKPVNTGYKDDSTPPTEIDKKKEKDAASN